MNEVEVEHRLTEVDQRAKSNAHRLDKLEPVVDEIHTMSKTMVRLAENIKNLHETTSDLAAKVTHIDNRVDEMERAPAEDAKKYQTTIITAIISTISGAAATGLLLMIAQYLK